MLFLGLCPITSHASKIDVRVRLSLGGAAVLGGGVLVWHLTYAYQVSKGEKKPGNPSRAASAFKETLQEKERVAPESFFKANMDSLQPLLINLPLLVFRW